MIRLAIAGCSGRMGRSLVEVAAIDPDVTLNAVTVSQNSRLLNVDVGTMIGAEPLNVKTAENLNKVLDQFCVLIDFTTVESTLSHIKLCVEHKKNMVIGTTGFTEDQKIFIQEAAKEIAIVLSPNMSIGVNLFFQLIRQATTVLGESADIEIIEAHHRHKVDAPSGTALRIGEIVAETLDRHLDEVAVYERNNKMGPRQPHSIGFSTVRAGDIVGEHTIIFASEGERLEVTHRASNRKAFALGAMRAAKWLNHKNTGLFTMEDVLSIR